MRKASLSIDFSALRSNLAFLKQTAGDSKVVAVVKANAYGHGAVDVAQALDVADAFGVAFLQEAIELRQASIDLPILVLQGASSRAEYKAAASQSLWLVVQSESQAIELLESGVNVNVWLKVDTGMGRLGISLDRLGYWMERLGSRVSCLMTHFSSGDDIDSPRNGHQIEKFLTVTEPYGVARSMANSGGLISQPEARFGWVRPGIALYGGNPFQRYSSKPDELQSVMSLNAPLVSVRWREKGDFIGYSGLSVCEEDMPVGVVSVGYADGYPRLVEPGTPVALNGILCPTLGRVSMDMVCVDLRNVPEARDGMNVELWGNSVDIDLVAGAAGTISYELMCQAGGALLGRGSPG